MADFFGNLKGNLESLGKTISEKAEVVAREIRQGSIDYAIDVFSSVEDTLKTLLEEVIRDKSELR